MSNDQLRETLDRKTREFRDTYNLYHISLAPGERILDVTSDHFMEVIPRVIAPVGLAIVCFLLAFFRASGGSVWTAGPPPDTIFTSLNVFLMILLSFVILAMFFTTGTGPRNQSRPHAATIRAVLGVVALMLLAMIVLTSQGVRFFDLSTPQPDARFFDTINIVLIMLALISGVAAVWIYIESENDHLILTNRRVILSDRRILGDYRTDQIYLEDVQNVISRTESYLQHYLRYGTIVVQSVRKSLVFRGGERAQEVQRNIDGKVKETRQQQSEFDFHDMIDTGIYDKPTSKVPDKPQPPISHTPRLLRWFLPPNPRYDVAKDTFIWYPHWIFAIITLLQPVAALLLCAVAIFIAAQAGLLAGGWLAGISLMVLIIFLGVAAYRIEDHVNDVYILTPTNIIDVEKLPWGPEDRRSASLGALQNATIKTSLLSRWIGYGDVFVETAGTGAFTFHRVPYPNEVVRLINKYQDNFKRGDKERAMKDTLKLLKMYHTEQVRQGEIKTRLGPPELKPWFYRRSTPDQE